MSRICTIAIFHNFLLYPNIPVSLLVTFTPFLIMPRVPSIWLLNLLNTEFISGWWAVCPQPCKCQVSAAARAPLNLNAHCRTLFFLAYENDVHLIEQCCLIYPLKLNFVTTKYYRDFVYATSKACYMSNTYFDHKISKYLAWFRIQIILHLLTNSFRNCLPAFCEHGKYIQRRNIGQFSFGISTQTKYFSLLYILLPVLWIYIAVNHFYLPTNELNCIKLKC